MKCNCGQNMRLVFYRPEKDTYKFFWGCTDYPHCQYTKDYKPLEPAFNISEQETMEAVNILENGDNETKVLLIDEIKVQMVEILNHFIDCTWGVHYMTLLNKMIIPYLDDPKVLDFVLKGPIIRQAKGNVYLGKSGAKMYDELYYCLRRVENENIQHYLINEFKMNKQN